MYDSVEPGNLLVATPLIGDPNFERTVVLVLEHSHEGSLGLVLNRPTDTDVFDPLPEWYRFTNSPSVIFHGGPVEEGRAIALARVQPGQIPGTTSASGSLEDVFAPLVAGVGTLDLSCDPDVVAAAIDELRVYSGYAGWGPAQLSDELDLGAWWAVAAQPDDLLSHHPDDLWRRVVRRQNDRTRLFADFPDDPTVN